MKNEGRRGIRVKLFDEVSHSWPWWSDDMQRSYTFGGFVSHPDKPHSFDLIEEPVADRLFSYEACLIGEDGRRRAVTRGGRDVVLLCGDIPNTAPIAGLVTGETEVLRCRADGVWAESPGGSQLDLLLPPPPKRVAWVNLYEREDSSFAAFAYRSRDAADLVKADELGDRLGNRAHPIEIEGDAG